MASLWTRAAIEEREPPLIVVASCNNQAVINILENFANVDESGLTEDLRGRWRLEVSSYGLYCCSRKKANDKTAFLYLGPNGESCMERWQTPHFLKDAKKYFLEKANQGYASLALTIFAVKQRLHQELVQTQQVLKAGINHLTAFQRIEHEISAQYGSVDAFLQELSSTQQLQDTRELEYRKTQVHLDEVYALWERRNLWAQSLRWLPSVRKQMYRRTARLLNRWDYPIEDYSDEAVEAWFTHKIQQH